MIDITGLQNPNSTRQLLPWLQDQGYPFEDVKAGHLKIMHERLTTTLAEMGVDEDEEQQVLFHGDPKRPRDDVESDIFLKRAIELRLTAAKTSPKKYYALRDSVDQSDPFEAVIRNCFQFAGAGRTWRWSGRLYQAQNLPKPATKELEKDIQFVAYAVEHLSAPAITAFYPEVMDVLTSAIRPCAQAPDGYVFVDVDLNAIENRVLGWIAKCFKILDVFYQNRDPYISFATMLFGGTYEELMAEYKAGDGKKRTIAKPGTLGCGYMLSKGKSWLNEDTGEYEADGLLGYAWNMGVKEFTLKQSALSVDTFRGGFDEVVDFWYDFERAFRKTVNTGRVAEHHMLRFERDGPFVKMVLPSGRALHYCRPRIEDRMKPWGKVGPTLTYESLTDNKQWARVTTHPGKVTENADQAIARDVFMEGVKIAKREYGLNVRIHVHDQAVATVREDKAEEKLKQLEEAMSRDIWWAPGLPLGAKGTISKLFVKD
jgi:DNA polymerase